MKKDFFKKTGNIILVLVLMVMSFFAVTENANAVPSSFQISSNPTLLPGYVNGTKFYLIPAADGTITYCLNIHKNVPTSQTMTLARELDKGIVYLMENGYPKKSITGNSNYDYYITQSAVWWYLDNTTGSYNLSTTFKTTGSDPHGLRGHMQNLVNGAMNARNQVAKNASLSLNASDVKLSLTADKKYYISKDIVVNGSNLSSDVKLSLQNAPKGTEILDSSNKARTTYKVGEKFKVRVLESSITGTKADIKVNGTATSTKNKAYEYIPGDGSKQNVSVLYPETLTVNASVNVKVETSIVKIIKLDKKTDKPLAGALLVLKDKDGKTITSWESTTKAHQITNLPEGTYILKESKAPTGYKLNTDPITFTITNDKRDVTVKMYNTPKTNVVNIIKIDKSTGNALAGATLVVKDKDGNVVARFVTTKEAYVLQDLEEGTYTVEEEKAPAGYVKSDEKKMFTIDENNTSHQITFDNYPEVIVPNTSSTTIMYLLGTIILLSGIGFVYYNAKKKEQQ